MKPCNWIEAMSTQLPTTVNDSRPSARTWSRRDWLLAGLGGLSAAALGSRTVAATEATARHHRPTARAVIWLFMNGGPSQIDTWDYKPALARHHGQTLENFDRETGFFANAVGPIMQSPFQFRQAGECGAWVSELFPHLAGCVDRMARIHSCTTTSNNHAPALFEMQSGFTRPGFPALGAWTDFGLAPEAGSLPGFCVMTDDRGRGLPKGAAQNWSHGFLPRRHQGSHLHGDVASGDTLQSRRKLALIEALNGSSERTEFFRAAIRMQESLPEAVRLSDETAATQAAYGCAHPVAGEFARQCLTARRLIERGVRCVQLYSGGTENEQSWDAHQDLAKNHRQLAAETDQPIAALLTDLEQRGLLDETLVLWGGEFGRLPLVQQGGSGRDHNPHAFTVWMAGGGIRGGSTYGETDELGLKATVDAVTVADLHATVLHTLGIDHERFTVRHEDRDYRITDVRGRVLRSLLS